MNLDEDNMLTPDSEPESSGRNNASSTVVRVNLGGQAYSLLACCQALDHTALCGDHAALRRSGLFAGRRLLEKVKSKPARKRKSNPRGGAAQHESAPFRLAYTAAPTAPAPKTTPPVMRPEAADSTCCTRSLARVTGSACDRNCCESALFITQFSQVAQEDKHTPVTTTAPTAAAAMPATFASFLPSLPVTLLYFRVAEDPARLACILEAASLRHSFMP